MDVEAHMVRGNLDVDLSNLEVALGQYSNLIIVAHSSEEFVLDFARMMPGLDDAKLISRMILTPMHAKRFFLSLRENLMSYEKANGEINMPDYSMNFMGDKHTEA